MWAVPRPSRRWSRSAVRATWTRKFSLRCPVTTPETTGLGSFVMALKPGDGSAREQAASCQRVLGGCANLAAGIRHQALSLQCGQLGDAALYRTRALADYNIQPGDQLWIPGVRTLLEGDGETLPATLIQKGKETAVTLQLPSMTREERDIVLAGCLINYYNMEN